MAFERFYITNQGAQYLALAQAGSKLLIAKAQIGTGYLGSGQSAVTRTALVSYLKDCPIQSKQAVGSTVNVTLQFVNTDGSGNVLDPFWWAEVGLFAKLDNDVNHPEILFAYANAMDQAHADYIPGTLMEFLFVMAINAQNAAENVDVEITAPVLYLATDGVASNVTSDVTVETNATVDDLTPGSTLKLLFGKIKKLITDILAIKASKVTGSVLGNFAGLDASGNLTDSGKKAADFANASHTHGIADVSGAMGGQNLLFNPGFYKDTTGWSMSAGIARDSTVKFDGACSIKFNVTGLGSDENRYCMTASDKRIPCSLGDIFSLSVWLYTDNYASVDRGAYFGIIQFNAGGASLSESNLTITPDSSNNGRWKRYSVKVTVTDATAVKIAASLRLVRNGVIWYAAVKLERGNIVSDWCPSWADMLLANPLPILIEDYISATLLNSYTGWIRYSKDATGKVTVRFSITPGTVTAGTSQAQLPAGYRPPASCPFQLTNNTSNAPANFRINSSGNIYNVDALTASQVYSGSFAFIAET